jgi:hypothetical protein
MKMECIANPWNSPNNINEYLSETVSENIIDLRDKVFEKCGLPSCGLVLIMDEENEAHYQGSFWEGKLGAYSSDPGHPFRWEAGHSFQSKPDTYSGDSGHPVVGA